MDPLSASLRVAGSGLSSQSARMRIVSENLANAQSTASVPGGDPYQRKTVTFAAELDKASGASMVRIDAIRNDQRAFPLEYDPGNVAADEAGYVKLPNVNLLIEMADMRETNRAYEANIQVMRQVRDLISMTIDLMRGA